MWLSRRLPRTNGPCAACRCSACTALKPNTVHICTYQSASEQACAVAVLYRTLFAHGGGVPRTLPALLGSSFLCISCNWRVLPLILLANRLRISLLLRVHFAIWVAVAFALRALFDNARSFQRLYTIISACCLAGRNAMLSMILRWYKSRSNFTWQMNGSMVGRSCCRHA